MTPQDDPRLISDTDALLWDHLDGRLEAADEAALAERLAQEGELRARLETFSRLRAGVREHGFPEPAEQGLPADFLERVRAQIVAREDQGDASSTDGAASAAASHAHPVQPGVDATGTGAASAASEPQATSSMGRLLRFFPIAYAAAAVLVLGLGLAHYLDQGDAQGDRSTTLADHEADDRGALDRGERIQKAGRNERGAPAGTLDGHWSGATPPPAGPQPAAQPHPEPGAPTKQAKGAQPRVSPRPARHAPDGRSGGRTAEDKGAAPRHAPPKPQAGAGQSPRGHFRGPGGVVPPGLRKPRDPGEAAPPPPARPIPVDTPFDEAQRLLRMQREAVRLAARLDASAPSLTRLQYAIGQLQRQPADVLVRHGEELRERRLADRARRTGGPAGATDGAAAPRPPGVPTPSAPGAPSTGSATPPVQGLPKAVDAPRTPDSEAESGAAAETATARRARRDRDAARLAVAVRALATLAEQEVRLEILTPEHKRMESAGTSPTDSPVQPAEKRDDRDAGARRPEGAGAPEPDRARHEAPKQDAPDDRAPSQGAREEDKLGAPQIEIRLRAADLAVLHAYGLIPGELPDFGKDPARIVYLTLVEVSESRPSSKEPARSGR